MTLEELSAIEAIKQLKGRYCYHIDYQEWDQYANLFTRDATLNTDEGPDTKGRAPTRQPEVRGRDAIRTFIARLLDPAETVHQVHCPVIELLSPTTAKGLWAMEDIVKMPGFHLLGRGHYRETYAIEDGQWRIASLHLTRTWIEILEGSAQGPLADRG